LKPESILLPVEIRVTFILNGAIPLLPGDVCAMVAQSLQHKLDKDFSIACSVGNSSCIAFRITIQPIASQFFYMPRI
jgi:hypothetical protein